MQLSVIWMALLVAMALTFNACGDDGPCTKLCEEVKPKLIEQLPDVSADDVRCSKAPWTQADTCDECLQILNDLFDVSVTDREELCSKHF